MLYFAICELTVPGVVHEMCRYGLSVCSVAVAGLQRVLPVVDVRGAVQLQAAVVLVHGVVVDVCADESPLFHRLAAEQPAQLRLWVARHAEGDAPVVVRNSVRELADDWRD